MTNSYSLSLRPKIVFFHGLNNNQDCFGPLIAHFQNLGFETEMVVLPGHGNDRKEARNLKSALTAFEQSMKRLKERPYHAIAFSQGALYLQLWLEKNQQHKPLNQVLLSPALYLRRQKIIEKLLKIIPSFFVIKSLSPRRFRRYEILTAGEYNTLVQGILTYQKIKKDYKIPTLVMIDPKDELVDAQRMKRELKNVEFIERNYLKMGMGQHHILFHPEYFQDHEWIKFTRKIETFLGISA